MPIPKFNETAQDYAKAHLSDTPPCPCDFQVGDEVVVKNGNGLIFDKGYKIIGFAKTVDPRSPQQFIYLDWDCYWFPKPVSMLCKKADFNLDNPNLPNGFLASRCYIKEEEIL